MHYAMIVVTADKPDTRVLETALDPYNEDNPEAVNPKWDWWMVGGRWLGLLVAKPGADFCTGEPGAGDNKPKHEKGVDSIRKGDIDWSHMPDGLRTFGILHKGEWFDFDDVIGRSRNTRADADREFEKEFDARFREIPEDHWITIVDCHV